MMDKISSLPPVSAMMRDSGLEPKKQFGQNFLKDVNVVKRIVELLEEKYTKKVEVRYI